MSALDLEPRDTAHPMISGALGATKIRLTGLAVASLLAHVAGAQAPARPSTSTAPVGVWRGTSMCLVRPSPCHDETVVYRIAATNAPDSLRMDARKIVGAEEQEMGVLTCHLASPDGPLTCAIPRATWQFRVSGDSLVGELRLSDGTRFRDVRTVRSQ